MGEQAKNSRAKRDAIKAEYEKWNSKRYEGVRIYTFEYIMVKLHERFFLSPKTIEQIVNGWGYYREDELENQLAMFNEDEDGNENVAE